MPQLSAPDDGKILQKLRRRYSTDRPLTPAPRIPEPYGTFGETFSYGI